MDGSGNWESSQCNGIYGPCFSIGTTATFSESGQECEDEFFTGDFKTCEEACEAIGLNPSACEVWPNDLERYFTSALFFADQTNCYAEDPVMFVDEDPWQGRDIVNVSQCLAVRDEDQRWARCCCGQWDMREQYP
jgi:hypothetical protein